MAILHIEKSVQIVFDIAEQLTIIEFMCQSPESVDCESRVFLKRFLHGTSQRPLQPHLQRLGRAVGS